MALTALDRPRLAAALREGAPVHLRLSGPYPEYLDEIGPLCDTARAADPSWDALLQRLLPPAARPDPSVRVTALIPTHQQVPIGLGALRAQDVAVTVRILSNGEGGPRSVEGAEVLRVPWEGHGRTRQRGVETVTDPYVLLTVDDAIPLGAGFVRVLVEALESGGWDAVVARQVPWPDADPVTRRRLRAWTPPGWSVTRRAQADHVATLYRTEALRRHPLPDAPIAEDAWWSRGRRIGYVPMAPVLHSHARVPAALYARNRDIHAELVRMGRPPSVSGRRALLGALPSTMRPLLRGQGREAVCQAAELLGQWQGARWASR